MPGQTATPHHPYRPIPRELQASDLTELQRAALRVIAECVALPLDQLARFLGCSPRGAANVVAALKKNGCVHSRRFLSGEGPWVWSRGTGSRLSGTGLRAKRTPPALASLEHRRAVHEVRLHLEARAPNGRWTCEPRLFSRLQGGKSDQVPDGVFEIGGERHAIEVERSRKSYARLRQAIAENSAHYDAVVYLCSPRARGQLDRIKAQEDWPKLIVRDLPGSAPAPRAQRRNADRDPEPWEAELLGLISEQGAIPLDQLARFLECTPTEAKRIARALVEATFARCEPLLAGQPSWLWLRRPGARLAPTSLRPWAPRRGGLEQIRTLNELRLQLEDREPNSKWIGRRTLLHRHGRAAAVPHAAIELPGEIHALLVRPTATNPENLIRRLGTITRQYDTVVCFTLNATVRKATESLQQRHRWRTLIIRDLPTPV
jgi:hypothetical protein